MLLHKKPGLWPRDDSSLESVCVNADPRLRDYDDYD